MNISRFFLIIFFIFNLSVAAAPTDLCDASDGTYYITSMYIDSSESSPSVLWIKESTKDEYSQFDNYLFLPNLDGNTYEKGDYSIRLAHILTLFMLDQPKGGTTYEHHFFNIACTNSQITYMRINKGSRDLRDKW